MEQCDFIYTGADVVDAGGSGEA